MAERVMKRTPELLAILVKRGEEAVGGEEYLKKSDRSAPAASQTAESKELQRGREESDELLCALRIAQGLGDLRSFFPNLGETFFTPLFHSLERLSSFDSLLSEYSKRLPTVVMILLSLWSPQMSTRKEQFLRAVPVLASYLDKKHSGVKFSAASLLESCHHYSPQSLESETERMIHALKDGSLVLLPALAHMFEIQPDAQGMWEEHLEWLFDMYEGRVSSSSSSSSKRDEQRAALALLFRNMAKHNFAILQPYVGRLAGGLKDEVTCGSIAEALYEIAKKDPRPMLGRREREGGERGDENEKVIGIIDDIKDTLKVMPQDHDKLIALLGVLGMSDPVTADDLSR
ncbi:hypothetical protein GUITHDRAFT_147618 [Guillardia theta CCMP2712]|uniref:HEAT repeat-containing protein 1 n=1 Tax=Guillardia theta (strain CCMP2712) TaxID=905079 RepID=L1IDB3_GUITC|nr:hypothetical protein GUITHDRAFT_147618 [Guillardia theta CCMP2712]EKX33899.1 hypothetical protein GUITHDRAFT_147618 [Guillardia theta CCMP2712]|eukprot:XP_005820879.1 hypothetical protein GUITHDRAFT_147618 [Guillardia theta CCMP2712]